MKIPEFLKEGDQVAVVATAKRLEKSIDRGLNILRDWGLKVQVGKNLNNQSGYFAGTDEERIKDAQLALDNPEIKAIIFARGGYGTTRILDSLDFNAFMKNPKWLVGFSDLTSILLQASTLEIPSIHGPACLTIGQDEVSDIHLRDLLFGERKFKFPLLSGQCLEGTCVGKIVGGNLSLIYESIGAPNEIETEENILFLEDVGEAKYSIDRMMTKLKRCRKLENLSGAIIGSFNNITDGQGYFSQSIENILMSYLTPLQIPVAIGLEAGHEKRNHSLIIGLDTKVKVSPNQLEVKYII